MIPFAFDVLLPDGPLGNGNLIRHLIGDPRFFDRKTVEYLPYNEKGGGVYSSLEHLGLCHPVHITQAPERFIYPLAMTGGIHTYFAVSTTHKSMFDGVSEIALETIRDGRALLLLDCIFEGHCNNRWNIFDRIYSQFQARNLSAQSICFVTSNLTTEVNHDQWCEANHITDRIHIFQTNFFAHAIRSTMEYFPDSFVTIREALNANRTKHFLSFNRRPHAHRAVFVSQMLKHRVLDRFLVSFPPYLASNMFMKHRGIPSLQEDVNELGNASPFIIDTSNFDYNHADTHIKTPYLDTHISVVCETQFYDTRGYSVFLSEKIYKTIANMHPFIIVGSANSLATLRNMGYHTFAPFINEAYDQELDAQKRMLMVIEEVLRLAAMPLERINEWYQSIIPQLAHNRYLLLETEDVFAPIIDKMNAFVNG